MHEIENGNKLRKMGVKRTGKMKSGMEMENIRIKMRVALEFHSLRNPRPTNYIHRPTFFPSMISCGIFDLETPCLPQIYTYARSLE